MRGRSHGQLAALIALAATMGGCVQATRHSNTMLFGTNTHFGIRAGTATGNVPEVNVGYSRQEAVVMPLVANTSDDGTVQKPCPIADPPAFVTGEGEVHPCVLVGVRGQIRDSYSVLASFGAKFNGSAKGDAAAEGRLAQYFATGVAAQMLAFNGGASVVALGEAAARSAENPPSEGALQAFLAGDPVAAAAGAKAREDYFEFRERLLAKVRLTPTDEIEARIDAFEKAATVDQVGVAKLCTSTKACRDAILTKYPYRRLFSDKQAALEAALSAWPVK